MTSRPIRPTLKARLRAVHARVRRAIVWRHALRASAAAAVLLSAAISAGLALPRTPGTAWARAAVLAAGSLVALAVAVRGALRDSPRWDPWLEALEARFASLRSWLRNALDLEARPGAHTSSELAGAVQEHAARRLADVPLEQSVPGLQARVPLMAVAAAVLAIAASVTLAPEPTLAAWRTLWSPASAAPPVELTVEPGDVTLVPGASLAVRARVEGTDAPPRLLGGEAAPFSERSPAAVLETRADGARRWRFDLPPVTAPREYAVRVAGVTSPTYRIALAGEPRAVSFSVTLTAPAYARLPQQALSGTRGDLSALAGSRAAVEVTFDRDLEHVSAAVGSANALAWSEVTPRRWRGTLPVDGDGHWDLIARGATGEGRFRYRIEAIPDAPPVLTVAAPAGDVDLPAGSLIPYDVLVQDDLGVAELKLEWKKDADAPWSEARLAVFGEEPREARAVARWDASPLALLPGESGVFRFVAHDNARPGPRGRAVSREIRVRFPTLSELYAKLEQRQDEVSRSLEKAAEQTKELQKSLDKLQRQPQGPNRQDPSFERAEEMKRAAESQQSVTQKLDEAARQMRESVDHASERQAYEEQLMHKLKEMSELLKEIQSQEFKDALKRMQEALQRMDRRAMEESLPQLQRENRDLLQQLERSLELLKQLRDEERMDALARRADELKARQDALNEEHAEQERDPSRPGDPAGEPKRETREQARKDLSQRQSDAAKDSRELSKDAKDTAGQSEDPQAKERLEQSAEELEQNAADQQDQATRRSEQGDSQGAHSSGQKASESLARAAQSLRAGAQKEQQERDQRNLAAVRRASQDLVSLARASQDNLDSRRGAPQASETQTDLSEGVARVADSLAALSQQTPFLSNRISTSLGRAIQGLSQSGREMSQGGRERGERSGRGAIASLNEAVKALRETEDAMCKNPGAGTGGRSSSQRMGEVGERQSQVNQRSRELARKLSRQMAMTQGDEAEMRRLADEQRRVREMLSEVRRDEEAKKSLLGRLDQAERDMQESEETIRRGQVGDDLEQKQIKILSRLLDASRSLYRRDFDPQREARRGEDIAAPSPAPLPGELFRENDRLRQDLLKAEADRVPSRYRSLIEAYLRALGGSAR